MKSHVNDLLDLATAVYKDAEAKCLTQSLGQRDLVTIRSRVKDEGLSFLTITLPQLGQDFERSLDSGCIAPGSFRSFRKRLKIPAFLQGFFELVFDSSTGRILHEPDVLAIECVRQLAYFFKKIELPCAEQRNEKAFRSYVQSEHDLSVALDQVDIDRFTDLCHHLWGDLLPYKLCLEDTSPKHGPGSTAERISGNQKYVPLVWHDRLEPYFPLFHNAFSSESAIGSAEFENVTIVEAQKELPVRVITVPKTLKAPRIIALEPVCMQYTQQALSKLLMKILQSGKVTGGHINFKDQTINQRLALETSMSGESATLDLSAASDRVPLSLALNMFDSVPDFRDAIEACRSMQAELPNGDVIPLKKFASMGSAMCFPVESMYFFTLCVMGLLESRFLPVNVINIAKVSKDIYVYGDDLIVPTDSVSNVIGCLQKYYCKVNSTKSFWNGNFRESCGMDAYAGVSVTPTYLRQVPPSNRSSVKSLLSWVATSNPLYERGYWRAAALMLNRCQTILGKLPIVGERSSALGAISFQRLHSVERWNAGLQVYEVKAWVGSPSYRPDNLGGYGALLKSLLSLEAHIDSGSRDGGNQCTRFDDFSISDSDHLSRTPRHGAVTLKRRWTRPY